MKDQTTPTIIAEALSDPIVLAATATPRHLVFAEGDDPRIRQAAQALVEGGVMSVTIIGESAELCDAVTAHASASKANGCQLRWIAPKSSADLNKYAQQLYELRSHKGVDLAAATKLAEQPLYFSNLMVASGDADGSVAGATNTTAATVRAAIQVLGTASGQSVVSSYFYMRCGESKDMGAANYLFADCALIVEPNSDQLASIAIATARSAQRLLREPPRVALLSFSTANSAQHPQVELVRSAAAKVRQLAPELMVSDDLQLDAALVPAVGGAKAPDCSIAGRANVLIFPNLAAGNIGYKLVQRFADAEAIGPILQGLGKPANDLSRGCNVTDIIKVAALTALQVAN